MPGSKNTHVCVACPFQPGDRIEAREQVQWAWGPKRDRWVPMLVKQVLPNNKMVLLIVERGYPPTVAVPYKKDWFRLAVQLKEKVDGSQHPQ